MHPATKALIDFFDYQHLPKGWLGRDVSMACAELAEDMVSSLPDDNAEVSAGLRKLLEAKDCFVRAALPR